MSYFTNIAVQNVNKGFVYITDLTWSLNLTLVLYQLQNAVVRLVQAEQTRETFSLPLTQPHALPLSWNRAMVASTTPRFPERLAGGPGRNFPISAITIDHAYVQVIIRRLAQSLATRRRRQSVLASDPHRHRRR
jgi:hypothetical protein